MSRRNELLYGTRRLINDLFARYCSLSSPFNSSQSPWYEDARLSDFRLSGWKTTMTGSTNLPFESQKAPNPWNDIAHGSLMSVSLWIERHLPILTVSPSS